MNEVKFGQWIPVTSRPMTREEYEENDYVREYDIPYCRRME